MEKITRTNTGKSLRQKAEELLKLNPSKAVSQLSESDTFKLIHEIEVHQIELEMQNEELKQAISDAQDAIELYDFAPAGYFTLSKQCDIINLNLRASQMLDKERSRLIKSRFDLFISDNTKPTFSKFIENVIASKSEETCEVIFAIKDCAPMYVLLTGILTENEENCLITAIDITERKKSEIELVKAKERAEESDLLKTAFLHNISHEIRTPMNAIMGFSRLILKNYNNKPKLEKFSNIIIKRTSDLLDIINDILDIAKIESGQLSVKMDVYNLNELFKELTSFFTEHQYRMGKQHIKFNLQTLCEPSEVLIITDKVKLKQIFINLINNAFKFTEKGSIEGGCKFDAEHKLLFYVTDTGIGISPDKQEKIFERFSQLNQIKNQAIGGTGLGLPIVKGLVTLLGGKIWLESEVANQTDNKTGGTTFYFSIPYKVSKSTFYEEFIEVKREYHFTNKTILVVEDDSFNTAYITEILSETGLNIIYAESGIEAIQIAASQTLDLILMDIRMPDMDGYEAASQILMNNPKLKIIAQTAYATQEVKEKVLNSGFIDYITKPLTQEALLVMINKNLEY